MLLFLVACMPAAPDRPDSTAVPGGTTAPSSGVLTVPPTETVPGVERQPGWTVAVWMAADNNLESIVGPDFDELERAVTDQVRIVAQADRSPYYSQAGGDWTDTRRVQIVSDPDPGIVSDLSQSIGEVDMGDAAALSDFLSWADQTQPSEHFALIFWGHGAGYWIASDDTSDSKIMLDEELEAALAPLVALRGPLDVIGFDACNMGQWEVAESLVGSARVMTASQAWVNWGGYAYDVAFPSLSAGADAAEFGDALARSAGETNGELTHAAIDLVQLEQVNQAIDALAWAWLASPAIGADFDRAREEARGVDLDWEEFWLDLGELGDAAARSPDPAVAFAGAEVRDTLAQAVIGSYNDERLAFASGLTIFSDTSVRNWVELYAEAGWSWTGWDELLFEVAEQGY